MDAGITGDSESHRSWRFLSWEVVLTRPDRICALKKAENASKSRAGWQEWVSDVWPIAVGIITWEFEYYSECCIRRE